MSSVSHKLDEFLFAGVDARAAAWYRIGFAAVIPFFFASGDLGVPAWASGQAAWTYENVFLSSAYVPLIATLCVLLALGWKSRATAFVLVAMLAPLDFLDGGRQSRQVIITALLAFSFVRSGTVRFPWTANNSFEKGAGPAWPIRLIQLQLTMLYGLNAIAKSSPEYLRGDALMDMSAELANFRIDFSTGALQIGLVAIPVALLAAASALMEYFLATAFWVRRLKWVAAISGIVFHFVLTRIVAIFMLEYAAIFLYLAFLLPLVRPVSSARYRSSPQPSGRRPDLRAPREASPAIQP